MGAGYRNSLRPFIQWDWGYHSLNDDSIGFDRKAYVDYFGFKVLKNETSYRLESLNFIDILSLENFDLLYKNLSWSLNLSANRNCYNCHDKLGYSFSGGLGLAKVFKGQHFWIHLSPQVLKTKDSTYIIPSLKSGWKLIRGKFSLVLENEVFRRSETFISFSEVTVNFALRPNKMLSAFYVHNNGLQRRNEVGLSFQFRY